MVLFITIRSFVTCAIVIVYNHDIGPYNLFQICNLFHDTRFNRIRNTNKTVSRDFLRH